MAGNRKLVDLVVDRYVNLELFYRKQETKPSGCIEWTGVKNNIGYGFIGFRNIDPATGGPEAGTGGMMTTHRLAWMIEHGRQPKYRNVNHTVCNNKLCVNPKHLAEGTQQEKLKEMRQAGIYGCRQIGKKYGSYEHKQFGRDYKYSEQEIQFVRTASIDNIVKFFNCSRKVAYRKRHHFRKGYRWLPGPEDKD